MMKQLIIALQAARPRLAAIHADGAAVAAHRSTRLFVKLLMLPVLLLTVACAECPALFASSSGGMQATTGGSQIVPAAHPTPPYADGRPTAKYRLYAKDAGIVYRYGSGPGRCDYLGARDVWLWRFKNTYYMNYDGAGPKGWLACLATSKDLLHWTPHGPVLSFGPPGSGDSASASYGTTYRKGNKWYMYYLGTPHVTPAPDFIPAFPYQTFTAWSRSPEGPWIKLKNVIPFKPTPHTYYSATASPGQIIRYHGQYLMFFSASTANPIYRTIGIARTRNLAGAWTIDPKPILPPREQIENTSLYFEPTSKTWFLFTDHISLRHGLEYTGAIWVYWSHKLTHWNPAHKAIVLDHHNCKWSPYIIGLPSVLKVGNRLAVIYDGNTQRSLPGGFASNMKRDIGLAWLKLPLRLPDAAKRIK